MISDQQRFCNLLDTIYVPSQVDAILVLRNHDPERSRARLQHAYDVMCNRPAELVMVWESDTKAEATAFGHMAFRFGWRKMVLVTERYHSYRAYLTFINHFKTTGYPYTIYMSCPQSNYLDDEEFYKIERYQRKGDVASYEEGIEWIRTLH